MFCIYESTYPVYVSIQPVVLQYDTAWMVAVASRCLMIRIMGAVRTSSPISRYPGVWGSVASSVERYNSLNIVDCSLPLNSVLPDSWYSVIYSTLYHGSTITCLVLFEHQESNVTMKPAACKVYPTADLSLHRAGVGALLPPLSPRSKITKNAEESEKCSIL